MKTKENSNELIVDAQIIEKRPLETIEFEINELTKQAQMAAIHYSINIGSRLMEAKSQVLHGEWENWLIEKVNYSQRTAESFMQIYKEYGNTQLGFFNTSDPQAFSNLSFTKLVTLLAIPAEDREEFAKDVDAESLSVRELKEKVKEAQEERDKAVKANEDDTEVKEALKKDLEDKQSEIDKLLQQIQDIEENADSIESGADTDNGDLASLRAEIEAEQKKAFQKKIDKLEKDKEKIQKEADALTEKLKTASDTDAELIRIKQEKADALKTIADMEKKLSLSANPVMQSLDFYFKQTQANIGSLKDSLDKLKESDPDQYDKFSVAIKSTIGDSIADL